MSAAVVVDVGIGFRTVVFPPDAAHRFRVIVLDRRSQVHVPLTVFANSEPTAAFG